MKKQRKSDAQKLKEAKLQIRVLERARHVDWLLNQILEDRICGKHPVIEKETCIPMGGLGMSGHAIAIQCNETVDIPAMQSGVILRVWANGGLHGTSREHAVYIPMTMLHVVIRNLQTLANLS